MKYGMRIRAFLIFCFLFVAAAVNAENGWKCISEKEDIRVYSREVPESRYNEFKVAAVVPAALETLVAVMSDVSSAPRWIENIEEARIIKSIDISTTIVYLSIGLPWPLADRDVITRSSGEFDIETVSLIIRSIAIDDATVPLKNGYIRMKNLKSEWLLRPLKNDRSKTLVEYTAHSNPEGYIPAFLVNLTMKDQMYHTITGLKKMSQNPAYINAGRKSEFKIFLDTILEKK